MRGKIEVETLLKLILILVLIWLGLAILGEFVDLIARILGPFFNLIGLIIVALIVLWLLDRL